MTRWTPIFWVLILLMTGCTGTSSLIATPTPLTCGGTPLNPPDNIVCMQLDSTTSVIQSQNSAQVIVRTNGLSITLNGTIQIKRTQERIDLAAIQGVAIVGVGRSTRILQSGMGVSVPLDEETGQSMFIGETRTIDWQPFWEMPLNRLPRQIHLPTPAPTPFICTPTEDWTGTYTVQAGDSLAQIAPRYGLNVGELVRGNCIVDANLLRVGQVLQVPDVATLTPSAP